MKHPRAHFFPERFSKHSQAIFYPACLPPEQYCGLPGETQPERAQSPLAVLSPALDFSVCKMSHRAMNFSMFV